MTVISEAELAIWADAHLRKVAAEIGRDCADKFAGILASRNVRKDQTLLPLMDQVLGGMQTYWTAKLAAIPVDDQSIRIFNEAFNAALKTRLGELRPAILADEARRQ